MKSVVRVIPVRDPCEESCIPLRSSWCRRSDAGLARSARRPLLGKPAVAPANRLRVRANRREVVAYPTRHLRCHIVRYCGLSLLVMPIFVISLLFSAAAGERFDVEERRTRSQATKPRLAGSSTRATSANSARKYCAFKASTCDTECVLLTKKRSGEHSSSEAWDLRR